MIQFKIQSRASQDQGEALLTWCWRDLLRAQVRWVWGRYVMRCGRAIEEVATVRCIMRRPALALRRIVDHQ